MTEEQWIAFKVSQLRSLAAYGGGEYVDAKSFERTADLIERLYKERNETQERLREAERETEKLAGLCDSNYAAGLTAGWNFGLKEDREGLNKEIERRQSSALSVIRARGEGQGDA